MLSEFLKFSWRTPLNGHHVKAYFLLTRTTFLLFLFFLTLPAFPQQAKQYVFTRYNTSTGLASNFVNNIVQDYRGFIWLATVNGFQRYDGHKFITYKNQPGNPSTVPTDNISFVFEDRGKNLWVATADNRIGIFNTENFTYREVPIRYRPDVVLNVTIPKKMIETTEGRLLLFMGAAGIYVLDPRAGAFVYSETLIPAPPGWKLTDIVQHPLTRRFYLAADSGIAVFNPVTLHLNYRGHNPDDEAIVKDLSKEVMISGLQMDSTNHLYYYSWLAGAPHPQLEHYNSTTRKKKLYDIIKELPQDYHEIVGILKQRSGRIWVYGLPFIIEYMGGERPFHGIKNEYKDEQSIQFDKVNAMYEDRESNIWISTDNGIFLFNPDAQLFNTYNFLRPGDKEAVETPAESFLHRRNGDIWVGSWGLGLYCYDSLLNAIPPPPSLRKYTNNWTIWAMQQHRATGQIVIGLQDQKMVVYDPVKEQSVLLEPDIFKGTFIRQITEDKMGNLWYGTQEGHIIKWDMKKAGRDFNTGYSLYLKSGLIHKMITDSYGTIWAATRGHGLLKINPATGSTESFTTSGPAGQRLSADAPYDIIQYDDSLMVIANGRVDVLNRKTSTIHSVSTEEGLPANNVWCLEKDNQGMLWLGMINGLCRMNLMKRIFIYYDRRDGISYDNFNVAGSYKMNDGRMFFATDHNFLVFDPVNMVQKDPPPDVKILDFKLLNKSILVDSLRRLKRITLEYNKNSISIGFGTLSYLRKNKKLFYYKMEKVDDDWLLADDRHEASYNNLPAGRYTFKVKTVNGSGVPSLNITTLDISVQPPFWRTWWFYGTIFLIGVVILYWFDKERVRRLITLQQVRTQIAGTLHDDINTTLNNIHLLSEIAKIKADKDIAKSKEYIDQINTKSRRMIDAMDDMLWSIDPQNDSMEKTLDRMQEFAEGLKSSHGCSIDVIVDSRVKSLKLDMKSRHDIFFIFKEALTHIVQQSRCTDSTIHIDLAKSALSIKIHDNGTGLESLTALNSNAVDQMRKRARVLNAILDFHADKKGTSVILQVPVRS